MSFNLNYFKGSSMNQVQYAIQYWMNALRPAEEVEALKKEKEQERVENVVVEGTENHDDEKEKEDSSRLSVPALCVPETTVNLYE